jgi:hypothetical protein
MNQNAISKEKFKETFTESQNVKKLKFKKSESFKNSS